MSKLQFWSYRISTILNAFKKLYTLSPEKVEAFVNSYGVYDFDWENEAEMIEKLGPDYYKKMQQGFVDYYCVLNHLLSLGQVEKMYIPPAVDLSKSIIENQFLIERRMAKDLGLSKGMKVLDIGCGRGRVASHMATISGANVTGMNIDPDQLASAKQNAQEKGLSELCEFMQVDLNAKPFPFPDNTFDAIYQIQCVFSLARDPVSVFKEINRILKPGGKFACLDWVSLPNYDPKNSRHADLMRRIKPLIGAVGTYSVDKATGYLNKAGFEVVASEIPSIDGLQAPLIEKADKFFTRIGKLIYFLVKCKILPAHFKTIFDRLTQDGQALVVADRERLVTTTYYLLSQKSANAAPQKRGVSEDPSAAAPQKAATAGEKKGKPEKKKG